MSVISSGLLKFGATWCAPCRAIKPALEAVKQKTGVELQEVDIDENNELSVEFGVRGVPTVFALKDGKVVDQLVGAKTEQEYLELAKLVKD